MDAASEARLALIEPTLAGIVRSLADQLLRDKSITIRIDQALRSWQEQDDLYAEGRTAPGRVVTNAPGGYSWHEFGLAVDFVVMDGGSCVWDLDDPRWVAVRDAAEAVGLVSGSRWPHPDWPHLQRTGRFPATPTVEARQIFKDAGMASVWREAFGA